MYIFGNPKNIQDLKKLDTSYQISDRSKIKIAIIDDEEFAYLEILRRHDFNISKFDDIEDIKAMHQYDIILCDIEGVGTKFSKTYQGAYVIKELRKYFPEKILIAYSSKSFDASFNEYFNIADMVLKKDIDTEEWVSSLDDAIKRLLNPIHQWKKLRNYLLDTDLPLEIVLRLEDDFVTNILNKKGHFPKNKIAASLPSDIRAIVNSFASSLIFKLLIG